MQFAAVILAAGASRRMGQPKLLLPWGRKTIFGHLVDTWRELGATQIAAVVEAKSPLEGELGDVGRIVNPQPELGMWSSVQCAARWQGWANDLTHLVITLGDQPQIGIATLKIIINFSKENASCICQPARNGRPRHPVIMPKAAFLELLDAKDANLKEFLRARESQRRMFESDDAALDFDIDTPEDYRRLVLECARGWARS